MNAIETLAFILFIVVLATAVSERINLPYPLLLVLTGLIVGFFPEVPNWHPDAHLILPLFLPPILFSTARLISAQDLKQNVDSIASLSVILVLLTAGLIAYLLPLCVPSMQTSVALVLGALIAPTDTVTASAILTRLNIRQHIVRAIEVESLFNDATGIVLYNAAVAFVFLGILPITEISQRMLIVGVGGIGVGWLFAYCARLIIKRFLSTSENNLSIIMSLILAYVTYLFADRIGVSGVLAVVTAGLYHRKTEQYIAASTRLSEKTVWDTLLFFLNGLLFVSIGAQFPSYLDRVSNIPVRQLVLSSCVTIASLIVLRMLWVGLTYWISHLLIKIKRQSTPSPFSYQTIFIVSWSGMRGLVSLALAIALPEALSEMAFPHRDLIIFLTLISILFTLLIQGLTLPWLIRLLKADKDDRQEMRHIFSVHQNLTQKALAKMETLEMDDPSRSLPYVQAAKRLVENYYANRLTQFVAPEGESADFDAHEITEAASKLFSTILQIERDELTSMLNKGRISNEIYIRVLRKIDRDEVGFASYSIE